MDLIKEIPFKERKKIKKNEMIKKKKSKLVVGRWRTKKFKIGKMVRAVAVGTDPYKAYIGCEDGTLREINLKTGELQKIITVHSLCVRHIQVQHDRVFSSANDKSLKCTDLQNEQVEFSLEGHSNFVPSFVLISDFPHSSAVTFMLCLEQRSKVVRNRDEFFFF